MPDKVKTYKKGNSTIDITITIPANFVWGDVLAGTLLHKIFKDADMPLDETGLESLINTVYASEISGIGNVDLIPSSPTDETTYFEIQATFTIDTVDSSTLNSDYSGFDEHIFEFLTQCYNNDSTEAIQILGLNNFMV